MTPSVSNFFSRDAMLKRQGRTARARRIAEPSESSLFSSPSLRSKPLNIIIEEDESRVSSRSPSPHFSASTSAGGSQTLGLKARRRHANVSDIRIARDVPVHDDNDLSPLHDNLLSAPRAAPRPPTDASPEQSPDSFRLTFTDVSFKFPHPPTPTPSSLGYYDSWDCESPARSVSSLSSSPCSQNGGMPLTPSTSDDESSFPSRTLTPHHIEIQPLVITKHNQRPCSPFNEISISPAQEQPLKTQPNTLPSPLAGESYDSDSESDSEWYTREFSKILTLCSPIPPSFPLQNPSRPESMSIPAGAISPIPSSRRRVSNVFPPAPTSSSPSRRDSVPRPSGQLDPDFPSRRATKTRSIPKYPPPPVPPIPAHFRASSVASTGSSASSPSSSPSPVPTCSKTLPHAAPRPPPRFSVPADCVFDLDVEHDADADDSSSAFSFSMYEIDLGDGDFERSRSESPRSAYSQPSFRISDDDNDDDDEEEFFERSVTFDLDCSMMLPLSLPATPIDLEADIALGLEKLRSEDSEDSGAEEKEEEVEEKKEQVQQVVQQPPRPQQPTQLQEVVNDVFSPLSPSFSSSPSPSPSYYHAYPSPSDSPSPLHSGIYNEERVLKSKWSSSTLGSIREEHERRGASAKLRLYFGGGGGGQSPSKRGSRSSSGSGSKKAANAVPQTPTSPFAGLGLISPRKSSRGYTSPPRLRPPPRLLVAIVSMCEDTPRMLWSSGMGAVWV
ncbi:hypothetical protein BDZ97DRAFT_1753952 [Flammula alnicola]|nr:hypothetical protein BDZ97DRAFT_1753952 [Flammula alnicola]